MLRPGSLVRVLSEPWKGALGLVKFTDREGVWLRLGNGVVVTLPEFEVDPVEYAPGTGCPATFAEELREGAWDFKGRGFPTPGLPGDRGPGLPGR